MTTPLPKEKPHIRSLKLINGVIDIAGWHPYDVIEAGGPFVCDYMKHPLYPCAAELTMDITGRCEDALEYFENVMGSVQSRQIELDPSRESTRKRFPWVNPFWHKIRVETSFGSQFDNGVYVFLGERYTVFDTHTHCSLHGQLGIFYPLDSKPRCSHAIDSTVGSSRHIMQFRKFC